MPKNVKRGFEIFEHTLLQNNKKMKGALYKNFRRKNLKAERRGKSRKNRINALKKWTIQRGGQRN